MPLTEAHELKDSVSDFVLDLVFLARLVCRPFGEGERFVLFGACPGEAQEDHPLLLTSDELSLLLWREELDTLLPEPEFDPLLVSPFSIRCLLQVVTWMLFLLCLRLLPEVHSAVAEQM